MHGVDRDAEIVRQRVLVLLPQAAVMRNSMQTMDRVSRIRFGHCELLPQHRELRVDGTAAQLGSRAFDLLMVLVERLGKVVTKNEILSAVWPGRIVEENTLQAQMSALRKALR